MTPREPGITLAEAHLRDAMAAFATGVTVVTVNDGSQHGMTASSFASLSLRPPLVLVCVAHDAVMHGCLLVARHFGVSILAAHQEELARRFADPSRPLGPAQFAGVRWRPGRLTGAPLLHGALAAFECEPRAAHPAGDHTIFVGHVLSLSRNATDPLLYYDRRFLTLAGSPGQSAHAEPPSRYVDFRMNGSPRVSRPGT